VAGQRGCHSTRRPTPQKSGGSRASGGRLKAGPSLAKVMLPTKGSVPSGSVVPFDQISYPYEPTCPPPRDVGCLTWTAAEDRPREEVGELPMTSGWIPLEAQVCTSILVFIQVVGIPNAGWHCDTHAGMPQ
jgi:hypothetical protein